MRNLLHTNENSRLIHSFDRVDRLNERQILDFQDLFLTNGIHYVDVDSLADARLIISTFLGSLLPAKRVACLTMAGDSLEPQVTRLHDELVLAGCLTGSPLSLESFLLEEFYYDFVWVECTPELLVTPWFWYFEQKLSDFNLGATFPILVLSLRNS